ncbi:arylsulfatase [Virgibacillus halodenitrificans]|uniref:arylsulfatase n=1 Tax=Virgibacillus halodenitrificans TaxID=1482 RepID=UPI002DB74D8E|nr:arylsulfatase [Virgibacillus halodenitrificans]MEC2158331.1 arylsulfatase [Virgibacillus halodenitrificans]
MKPNVLLIMVDQMRADCLSMLNHPVVDTPNLDQLARNGALFNNAYAATPSCVPARASVLTGMSQTSTKRVGYEDKVDWNYENSMPGEFAKAGYHTQCVGKMHVYPTRNLCGFHNVILHDGYMHYNRFKHTTKSVESFEQTDDYLNWLRDKAGSNVDLTDLGLDCNSSTVTRPWALPEELHPTNWVTTQSIDFLRRRDTTKPFFLKMSYVRPHPPFDPPEAFYSMYRDLDLPEPPIGNWTKEEDSTNAGLNPVTSEGIVPKRRLERAQAAYYALITHIDHQIGRFLMAMQEYGVYDNTVILFVSDHGELLGDHNLYRKTLPYEGSAKVPLILADPGNCLGLNKNTQIDKVAELRDIMPTLLEVANIEIPSSVEGDSLLSLWKNENTNWRDYIHGEHEHGVKSYHYITNGREKYIWFSQTGEEQFFDLVEDPKELTNKIEDPNYEKQVKVRRDQLILELVGREEGYTDGKELFAGRPVKPTLKN